VHEHPVLDVKPTCVDDTKSDEDNVHLDFIEAETEVIVKAVDSMLTDGIATTQPRQKSSMCLARRCLMNSVLGINKNPLSTQKSPPCKMPRKERFIDETHFVTMLERDERKDIVFSKEIRDRARKEGKERMSDKTIKKYVMKLYSLSAFKPRKFVNGKLMQASRFKHIKLSSAVVGDSTNTMRIHGVPVQVMRKKKTTFAREVAIQPTPATVAAFPIEDVSVPKSKLGVATAPPTIPSVPATSVSQPTPPVSAREKAVFSKIRENLTPSSTGASTCIIAPTDSYRQLGFRRGTSTFHGQERRCANHQSEPFVKGKGQGQGAL